jgi:hypothetical protein
MIVRERFPWYMGVTAFVGGVGLITGIGTLTEAFTPLFGAGWALGVAALIDTLAISLTVWAIQAMRGGIPAGLVRLCAHALIGVSIAAQAGTAYQGLSGTAGGWTSAAAHVIPPMVLGLALELIYRHYASLWRARTAPTLAAQVLREEAAKASVGVPVNERRVQRAVVECARAGTADMVAITARLSREDLSQSPALDTLLRITAPRELPASPESAPARARRTASVHVISGEAAESPSQVERRAKVRELDAAGRSCREIARELGCSPSTVSADLRALEEVS